MMVHEPVESERIETIGHDQDQTMEVVFKDGSMYRYHPVPVSGHAKLMAAASKGSFLHKMMVKGVKVRDARAKVAMQQNQADNDSGNGFNDDRSRWPE